MVERDLYRWGGIAAVVGALAALVANALHPRITDLDDATSAMIEEVARSGAWVPLHLVLIAAILLIAGGLFALARSLKGGPAEGLARLAKGSLLISTSVALVTLGIDGFSSKDASDAWAAATGPGKDAAFAAAAAVVTVAWGAFMVMTMTFIGLTPMLFGLAITRSQEYPAALGWPVAALGAVGIVAGVVGFGGQSTVFWILFLVSSGLLTLWILVMGVLLGRKAAALAPAPSPA